MLYIMLPSIVYFRHSINSVYVSIPISQFLLPLFCSDFKDDAVKSTVFELRFS